MNVYGNAMMESKREANSKVVKMGAEERSCGRLWYGASADRSGADQLAMFFIVLECCGPVAQMDRATVS